MATSTEKNKALSAYAMFTRNKRKSTPPIEDEDKLMQQKKRNSLERSLSNKVKKHHANGIKKTPKKKSVDDEPVQKKYNVDIEDDQDERETDDSMSAESGNENSCESPTTPKPNLTENIGCDNFAAEEAFKWLLNPMKPHYFFEKHFDESPVHIRRPNRTFYQELFSLAKFEEIIKNNNLNYDKEIDIVSCVGCERIPVSNPMKVHPSFVWKCFHDGNSIRMRNPQAYDKKLWKLCSLLQEYFGSFVGVNMYLTPAGAQGFPPHYDDIDGFILQVEGRKLWRVYKPQEEDLLARYSSNDLTDEEIGEPSMEIVLESGDLLYLPRGYIHQAMTTEDVHSLHLTFSTNQLNTWGDLLSLGISNAVQDAIKSNIVLRKSLPRNYMDIAGASYSDCVSSERTKFEKKFRNLAQLTLKYLDVDSAVDRHAADFIHGSVPPVFNRTEKMCSIHGNGDSFKNGQSQIIQDLTEDTKIRLIRKRAFRLVMDEDGVQLFYTLNNSKNHKEDVAVCMDLDDDVVPAINLLFRSFPNYIEVKDLPIDSLETKLSLAQQLYDNGFLITEFPLAAETM